MCDEVNKAEKPEAQAAATAASQVATPATTAAPQAAAMVEPQVTVRQDVARKGANSKKAQVVDPEFARAENEDDDGYDPYSDRRPVSEPLFERDPWS